MADYCTPTDVRKALAPAGANDQSTAAEMDDPSIMIAITDAQAEVDGHLRDRYAVPFENGQVPELVKALTRDVAAYLATLTHRRTGSLTDDDVVWLRYSRASALLERLGDGLIDLDAPGTSEALSTDPTVVNPRDFDLFSTEDLGRVTTYLS